MAIASTLRIAWRNLGRNRRRAAMALGAIAVGQLAFLGSSALMHGYAEELFGSLTGPFIGHIQIHAPEWREERAVDLTLPEVSRTLASLRTDPEVARAAPRIFAPMLAAKTREGFMAVVVGVDPAQERWAEGLLSEAPPDLVLGDRRVAVGAGFARVNGLKPGDELALVGQDADGAIANDLFTIAAVLPSSLALVNDQGVVMSMADAQELLLLPDQAHEIIIHVHDREAIDATVARLTALPALAGTETLPWYEIVPHLVAMFAMVDVYLWIVLFIVLLAAAAGIANTMLMSTYERTHEFGMLLSLGCHPRRLAAIICSEAVILGQLGVVIGSTIAIVLLLLTPSGGIDYAALGGNSDAYEMAFEGMRFTSYVVPKLYPRDVLAGAGAVLLTSLLAVLWPMAHISRMQPMEALRA